METILARTLNQEAYTCTVKSDTYVINAFQGWLMRTLYNLGPSHISPRQLGYNLDNEIIKLFSNRLPGKSRRLNGTSPMRLQVWSILELVLLAINFSLDLHRHA